MPPHWLLLLTICAISPAQQPLYRVLGEPLPFGAERPEATADFDLDGDVDLLTRNGIFVNDGDGCFSPAPGAPLAFSRDRAYVVDLNGDGQSDVISVVAGRMRIDLSAGVLSFVQLGVAAVPPLVALSGLGYLVETVAPGDVDGDGDQDLLLTTSVSVGSWGQLNPAAPQLLLNTGSGRFVVAAPTAFPLTNLAAGGGTLADLDGDGDLDVAVFGEYGGGSWGQMWWSANAGGTFGPPALVGNGSRSGVALGDFDGNGIADLAAALGTQIAIYFGGPTGPGPGVVAGTTGFSQFVTAVDVDQDGADELLSGAIGSVVVHAVGASGAITPANQEFPGLSLFSPALAADLDGDGDRDLVLRAGPRMFLAPTGAILLMNDGAGTLVPLTGRMSGIMGSYGPQVGDVDGDGDADILRRRYDAALNLVIATLLNDGDGTFSVGPSSTIPAVSLAQGGIILHAFDWDGDGDVDLYGAPGLDSTFGSPGSDFVLENASGTFSLLASPGVNVPVSVVRDFDADGDGDLDLLLGRRMAAPFGSGLGPPMLLVRNLGGGLFAPAVTVGPPGNTYDLEVGDFDGDGSLDVFQTNSPPPGMLYLNTGTGSFTAMTLPAMAGSYSCAGDLDGDGFPDLVINGQVWFNAAGSGFWPGPSLPSPIGAPATLADVDEDGDLDLVESPATVMTNTGVGFFAPPVSQFPRFALGANSRVRPTSVLVDVDQDGDLDAVGSDWFIHSNIRRQISVRAQARPGRTATLELWGPPGQAYMLFCSATRGSLLLPPFGTVMLDLSTLQCIQSGWFTPPDEADAGLDVYQIMLPDSPALVGRTIHWQMIDSVPRLSNHLGTVVRGY